MGLLKELIAYNQETVEYLTEDEVHLDNEELGNLLLENYSNINSFLREIKNELLNVRRDLIFIRSLNAIKNILNNNKKKKRYKNLKSIVSYLNQFPNLVKIKVRYGSYKNMNSRMYKKKIKEVEEIIDDLNKGLLRRLKENFDIILKSIELFSTTVYNVFNEIYQKRSNITKVSTLEKISFRNKTKLNKDKKIIDELFSKRLPFFDNEYILDTSYMLFDKVMKFGIFIRPNMDLSEFNNSDKALDCDTYYISPKIKNIVEEYSNDRKINTRLLLEYISSSFVINEKIIEKNIHDIMERQSYYLEKIDLEISERNLHFLSLLNLNILKPIGIYTKEYLYLNYSLMSLIR